MENQNVTKDSIEMADFEQPKLSTGLNVLTILSFIGCAIQLLTVGWQYFSAKNSFEQKDQMIEKMSSPDMPAAAKAMMPDMTHFEEMITKAYENRLPILILGLVATALCFYGVLEMRKLKKQGYLFYVIGELLPFISMILFLGAFSLTGFGFYLGAFIALLFILLYTMQRKYLVK